MLAHKPGFLRGHCDDVGRDVNEIEVSVGALRGKTDEAGRELVVAGATMFTVGIGGPHYDLTDARLWIA